MVKTALLTFDLEEFVIPREQGLDIEKNRLFEISKDGFYRLKSLLDKKKVKSTFFTTLEFAENCPDIIKTLVKDRHEIAVHGNTHQDDYKNQRDEKNLELLKQAKKAIEQKFNTHVYGFRGPQLKHPAYQILRKAGFEYDSSLHPTYIPGYYNNFLKSRRITEVDGVKLVPISVTPIFRLPFSWFWFKNLGLTYAKLCTRFTMLDSSYVNIYFHPWEFGDLEKFEFDTKVANLSIKNSGKKLLGLLEEYLSWVRKKNYMYAPIRDFLRLK